MTVYFIEPPNGAAGAHRASFGPIDDREAALALARTLAAAGPVRVWSAEGVETIINETPPQ